MRNAILGVIASVILLAVIFLIAVYGFGFLQRETAEFRGETSQIEKTQANANYRIASYDQFYDKCASIQSIEKKIVNMKEELALTSDDTQRKTVLNTSITASKNKRAELITQYNADARKEATQGQFRASDLPYQIEEEGNTLCESY